MYPCGIFWHILRSLLLEDSLSMFKPVFELAYSSAIIVLPRRT